MTSVNPTNLKERSMAQITFKGTPISTLGSLPAVGAAAPGFKLVAGDLSESTLADFAGKTLILNIVPSLDTGICQASARRFNEEAIQHPDVIVANVSLDLPFAQGRFCESAGLKNVKNLSAFRSPDFGKDYAVTITSGPLTGLLSRAVVVVSPAGKVVYTEQVPEIAQEPNYDAALAALA
jgi:thioredoxin-dependent peroxiredoxin